MPLMLPTQMGRRMRLEVRPQPSPFWSYASPMLALLITVVIGIGGDKGEIDFRLH